LRHYILGFLPDADLHKRKHATCAVVGNAGTMLKSGLGPYIDAHDAVIRINYAPTRGFEADVGASHPFDFSYLEKAHKQLHNQLRSTAQTHSHEHNSHAQLRAQRIRTGQKHSSEAAHLNNTTPHLL
jgi:hypothetical protein